VASDRSVGLNWKLVSIEYCAEVGVGDNYVWGEAVEVELGFRLFILLLIISVCSTRRVM
jgi:hypothetical protein